MAAMTGLIHSTAFSEEMGDLAEPEQHRRQDEERQNLHEVPLHPGVGLGEDIGQLRQPHGGEFHVEHRGLSRHQSGGKEADDQEDEQQADSSRPAERRGPLTAAP